MLGLHHFAGRGGEGVLKIPLFSFREEINEVVCYPQSEAAFPPADKSSVWPSDEHANALAAGQIRRKHCYRLQRMQSETRNKKDLKTGLTASALSGTIPPTRDII
ncbi:hypothetical protein CEXT_732951 [Caerostris extrusa]|uniref:Uncharacterized protein n=1 Tax=Caerostris extrusa TaxID=172846 RepID=A0AAV4R0X3_CAEEX|nr:hypothetical protein CEXT_732951 [Caerostris extrusa]